MFFQNYLTKKAAAYVNDQFNTQISIGEISYDGWSYFSLRNVLYGDNRQDTLFFAGRVQFNLAGITLDSTQFILNHVLVDRGICKINTYKDNYFGVDAMDGFLNAIDTTLPPSPIPFVLELRDLECTNSRFDLVDSTEVFYTAGFDPFNMHVSDVNFRSRRFQIINDSLHFDLHQFSLKEQSGFEIKRMESVATVSPTTIRFSKMDMKTKYSQFQNYFSMDCSSWDDYMDFVNKVKFDIRLKESDVDFKDIVYFAPLLKDFDYKAVVSGHAKGPLSNLTIKKVKATHGNATTFDGDINLIGLPDVDKMFMDIDVTNATSDLKDLKTISGVDLPNILANLGKMHYQGRFTGFYKDFVSFGNLTTDCGAIHTDLNMKLNDNLMQSSYKGNFQLEQFNLGQLLNKKVIGKLNFNAEISGKGFDLSNLDNTFKLKATDLYFNNYTYALIELNGKSFKDQLDLDIRVLDSCIDVTAQSSLKLTGSYKYLGLNAHVKSVNLDGLNLYQSVKHLGFEAKADFHFKDLDENNGTIQLKKIHYERAQKLYQLNHFELTSTQGAEKSIVVKSDDVNAKIEGQFDFDYLQKQISNLLSEIVPNYFKQYPQCLQVKEQFKLQVSVKSANNILPFFTDAIEVSQLKLDASINESDKKIQLNGNVGKFVYNDLTVKKASLNIMSSPAKGIQLEGGFNFIGNKDSLLIGKGDFGLNANQKNGDLYLNATDSSGLLSFDFNQKIVFEPNQIVQLHNQSGKFWKGSALWQLNKFASIVIGNENVTFNQLIFNNQSQLIAIDGFYAFAQPAKNIVVKFNDVKINGITPFIPWLNLEMGGLINGLLSVKHQENHDLFLGDLELTSFTIDKDSIGDVFLNTAYGENEHELLLSLASKSGKFKNLKAIGKLNLQTDAIDFNMSFSNSPIRPFQSFMKGYVSIFDGTADLNAQLTGTIQKPKLTGQLELSDAKFKIDFLQTTYQIPKALLNFNQQTISFKPFKIQDKNKQFALVSGGVKFNGFSQWQYDIQINEFEKFQCLSTTANDNSLFYGNVYATGNASITGNTNNVMMDVKAVTDKNSQLVINPFGGESENGENFLHFTSRDTTYEDQVQVKHIPFGFGIRLAVEATPDAEAQLVFGDQTDDVIKAKGRGNLLLNYTPQGNFFLNGKYELTEGEYRLSAMNVVAKKFNLKQGSTIEWDGDPMTGKLDILGVYKLRTTIGELVNTSAAADPNGRVPVECLIQIKGTVDKPNIGFDLNFPDMQNNLNGSSASELNAVLSNFRKEPELMTQQIVFLLISGKFIPINNSSNNLAGSLSSQTVSDLLSKQAASLLSKLDPEIDLTVDMLNATDPTRGRAALLSASRRFLDNRLELQGSFATDNSQNNFAATYNFKKNGNLKAKVFNKMGFDLIYSRNITTSGVGLFYRKEFDHLIDLFKKSNTFKFQ